MNLRKLNFDLQHIANSQLNEDPTRIEEGLQHIRNWLQKQPHLTARLDDQFLLSFLRGCKWSFQKTKEKIDSYYTIRSFLPEIFTNRDPFLLEIQCLLEAGLFFPLPNTNGPAGPRILYYNLSSAPTEKISNEAIAKLFFMTLDILLKEDDYFTVPGFQIIGNYKNVPLSFILQVPPALIKKYVICITKAYPMRGKLYVGFNAPLVFETLMNTVVKPFLKEKSQKRFYFFNSTDVTKSNEILDTSLLPKELGGQNGSLNENKKEWKAKLESYRDWFLEDVKYGSNEKLRIGPPKTYDDNFGMDGSFKKLNID